MAPGRFPSPRDDDGRDASCAPHTVPCCPAGRQGTYGRRSTDRPVAPCHAASTIAVPVGGCSGGTAPEAGEWLQRAAPATAEGGTLERQRPAAGLRLPAPRLPRAGPREAGPAPRGAGAHGRVRAWRPRSLPCVRALLVTVLKAASRTASREPSDPTGLPHGPSVCTSSDSSVTTATSVTTARAAPGQGGSPARGWGGCKPQCWPVALAGCARWHPDQCVVGARAQFSPPCSTWFAAPAAQRRVCTTYFDIS
jgi:hypothetical protein